MLGQVTLVCANEKLRGVNLFNNNDAMITRNGEDYPAFKCALSVP